MVLQMKSDYDFEPGCPVSEIAIVDTFTRLIFGEEDGFSPREQQIIQALGWVENSIAPGSHRDMGRYLRTLEVAEMIRLVTAVQACLADGLQSHALPREESVSGRPAG